MTEKGIPVLWEDDDSLDTHYVNNMFVSHSTGEFYIVFGELSPIVRNENMELPDAVYVKPVVRLVISPDNLKEFLDILNTNFQKYEEKKK